MKTCLVWDWLLEKDHLVRILKMLLTLHCIVMSPPGTLVDNVDIHGDETVAVYNSVQCPVMTCVHIAETGGESSWSGSEYWGAETLTVTRPHSIIITPDTII